MNDKINNTNSVTYRNTLASLFVNECSIEGKIKLQNISFFSANSILNFNFANAVGQSSFYFPFTIL